MRCVRCARLTRQSAGTRVPARVRTLGPIAAVLAAAACCLAASPAVATSAAPRPARATAPTAAPPALTSAQQHYLRLAQAGVASAKGHWRDRRLGWYDELLNNHARYPLATIWDIVPLFESIDAI